MAIDSRLRRVLVPGSACDACRSGTARDDLGRSGRKNNRSSPPRAEPAAGSPLSRYQRLHTVYHARAAIESSWRLTWLACARKSSVSPTRMHKQMSVRASVNAKSTASVCSIKSFRYPLFTAVHHGLLRNNGCHAFGRQGPEVQIFSPRPVIS